MSLYSVEISPAPQPETEAIIKNRYRLLKKLGSGGMGEVHLVEDLAREREQVVLKLLHSDLVSNDAAESLRKEFSVLASMEHPNLVKVYDFGKSSELDKYYFTMEYLEGVEFFNFIEKQSIEMIITLFAQLVQAIDFIHSAGVYHGDIKSENILVLKKDKQNPQLKIMDFGLSGSHADSDVQQMSGTVAYMAPERFRGAPLTPQTDLYAIGVLMYWAVSGNAPFTGSADEIKRGHLAVNPKSLSSFRPDVPKELENIILRLLSKDPIERFKTSGQVIDALNELKDGIIDISDTIPSILYNSFKHSKSAQVESAINQIFQILNPGDNGQDKDECNFITILGNEGSGHELILDEIKHKLQVKDVVVCEGYCFPGIDSSYKPIMDACKSNEVLEASIEKIYTDYYENLSEHDVNIEKKVRKEPELLRYQFFENISQALEDAAKVNPFVFILRNIEFADEGTLDLYYFLARSLSSQVVFCTSSSRDRQSQEKSRNIAERNNSLRASIEINIGHLVEEDIKSLLKHGFENSMLSNKVYEELYKQTGGVLEIIALSLAELNKKGYFTRSQGVWVLADNYNLSEIAPKNITELYIKIYDRLPEPHKEIVQLLVVYGESVDTAFIKNLLKKESADIESSLTSLLTKNILKKIQSDFVEKFDLWSNGIRETIYDQLTSYQRRELHFKIVRMLETSGNKQVGVEQLAYHYLKAGLKEKGLTCAARAYKRMCSEYAHRPALKIASLALSSCEDNTSRFELGFQRRIAQLQDMLGETKSALETFKNISSRYKPGVARAAILRHIASIYHKLGNMENANKTLDCALDQVSKNARVERALLLSEKSWTAGMEGNKELAIKLGQMAYDELVQRKVGRALAITINRLGVAYYLSGNWEQAIKQFSKSAKIKKQLKDEKGLATTTSNIGMMYNITGNSKKAIEKYEECLNIRERIGDFNGLAETYNNFGISLFHQGEYSRAYSFYIRAKSLYQRIGNLKGLIEVLLNLGELDYYREDYSASLEILDEGLKYARRINDARAEAELLYYKAKVFLLLNKKDMFKQNIDDCLIKAVDNSTKERLGVYYILKNREREFFANEKEDIYLAKAEKICLNENDPILDIEISLERIRVHLERGLTLNLIEMIKELITTLEAKNYRWYHVKALILQAKAMMSAGIEKTYIEEILQKAEKMARTLGLFLSIKDIYLIRGRLLCLAGNDRKAFQEYRVAFQHLKSVLASIKQAELKKTFLSSKENMELVNEIKKVQSRLVK